MPDFKQKDRLLSVKTPLGDDVLLADRMTLTEQLSRPFVLQLDLLARLEDASKVGSKALIGKSLTLSVKLPDGSKRFVNGICSRFVAAARDVRFVSYRAEVVPQLWLLTLKSNCRVFQDKSVPDILKEVLQGLNVDWKLTGTYRKLDYCVQYRETDFNFASRIMEQEGIYYLFKHDEGSHSIVMADSPDSAAHVDAPGQATARFTSHAQATDDEDLVTSWELRRSMVPGKYAQRDYNFQTPDQTLENTEVATNQVGGNDKFEIYDYPGEYAQRFNKPDERLDEMFVEGPALTKVRVQESEAGHAVANGASTCRAFAPGLKFELVDNERRPIDMDKAGSKYLITSVCHSAGQSPGYVSDDPGEGYRNSVTAIPAKAQFRTARTTPRPVVQGLQTAVVVGPKGEEIYVDKYGRIKVQFHWDRYGKKDESSSCWVRVGQSSAGGQWGAHFWPRMGHEVLVAFLEGDPDAPIVVGSVYNNKNMPPYTLPDNKTRGGVKTHSTLKGSDENFNELRFEDKKGQEEIYLHAEKDLNVVVENNETRKVGFQDKDKGDQTIEVFNNQTNKVGCAQASDGSQTTEIWKDRKTTIKTGNDTLLIEQGNMSVTLSMGNQETKLKMGNESTTLDMGNMDTTLKLGNMTTKLNLGKSTTEALQGIELKVMGNSIKIDPTGVTIKGLIVKIEGEVMTTVKGGAMNQIQASGILMAKGALTMIN